MRIPLQVDKCRRHRLAMSCVWPLSTLSILCPVRFHQLQPSRLVKHYHVLSLTCSIRCATLDYSIRCAHSWLFDIDPSSVHPLFVPPESDLRVLFVPSGYWYILQYFPVYLFLLIHQHPVLQNNISDASIFVSIREGQPVYQIRSMIRIHCCVITVQPPAMLCTCSVLTYTHQVQHLATACPPSRSITPTLADTFFCSELPHLANVSKDSLQLAFHQFQLILIAISAQCHITEHTKCQSILL